MDDLYRELIIDRYKNPQFQGELEAPDITFEDDNPLCGDHIKIDMRVDEDGNIGEVVFSGEGCAISLASTDLLIESIQGKRLEDVKHITKENFTLEKRQWKKQKSQFQDYMHVMDLQSLMDVTYLLQ